MTNHKLSKIFVSILLSIFLSFPITTYISINNALADHVSPDDEMIILTNGLLQSIEDLIKAQSQNRQKAVEKITASILKRKIKLLEMIDKNPKQAFRHLLPPELTHELPADIRELLEAEVEIKGDMQVEIVNFSNGTTKTIYTLKDSNNPKNIYELHFADSSPNITTGSKVKITGVRVDKNQIILEANGNLQTVTQAPAVVSGNQNTLIIPIDFQDKPGTCSDSNLNALFFTGNNSIKNYYSESSFNQMNITGTLAPRVTIPYKSTDSPCNYSTWSNAADSALATIGFNISGYSRKVYQFPNNTNCPIGVGTMGGNPSRSWVFRCDLPDVTAHEYGHNLGWHHSSSGTLNTDGDEYGDTSCVMGYGNIGLRQPNAAHKVEAGWIPSSRVQTIINSGTYTIYNSENGNNNNIQVLKIAKPDTNEYFYLSYRTPTGFDQNLNSFYTYKTSVHRWNGQPGNKTYLLANLNTNNVFSDPNNGISFKQLSQDANSSVVKIDFGPPSPCTLTSPTIDITPANQVASKGNPLTYTIGITNNNNPTTCSTSNYTVKQILPSGWTGSADFPTIDVDPASREEVLWTVRSPANVSEGSYTITAQVNDSSNSRLTNSINAMFTVFSSPNDCVFTNPTINITPSNQAGLKGSQLLYGFTVKNNDNPLLCPSSTFKIEFNNLAPDWKQTSIKSVSISPGQTYSYVLYVNSSTSANEGEYLLTASATNLIDPTKNSSVNTKYTVANVLPPSVVIDKPLNGSILKKSITLKTHIYSSTTPIAKVDFYVDDVLIKTMPGKKFIPFAYKAPTYNTKWNAKEALPGAHTIKVIAYDTANRSWSESVTITKE